MKNVERTPTTQNIPPPTLIHEKCPLTEKIPPLTQNDP